MTFQGDIRELQRAHIVDRDGEKVGTVSQLYLTDDSREPSWVTVNTGLFGTKESFIPLAEARLDGDTLTVPYDKATIKGAPHVPDDGNISREDEEELYRYYNVDAPHAAGDDDGRREDDRRAGDNHGDGDDRADGDDDRADGDDDRLDAVFRDDEHSDQPRDAFDGGILGTHGGNDDRGNQTALERDDRHRDGIQDDPYADADRGRDPEPPAAG